MALFSPGATGLFRAFLLGLAALILLSIAVGWTYYRSPWETGQERTIRQPVPFSHEHHVSGLAIDCRYCHETVEKSAFAGMPATEVCMSCHSQIWTNAEMLEPVRDSLRYGVPIRWNRVHATPDYVYFNHSIHIHKGIGCETCHGRIDRMPLVQMAEPLSMDWCLDCHRNPERHVRPREAVYEFGYEPEIPQEKLGPVLVERYKIHSRTDCYTCHR